MIFEVELTTDRCYPRWIKSIAVTSPKEKIRQPESFSSGRFFWAGLLVVVLAFVFAAAISWRRWPDLLVDFGGQLYMPWRLANGAVLYRDLFYFAGGPFSQYFNALLFKIFGASFFTLIAANLMFVAATVFLIYRRFLAVTDVFTATAVCLGIVLVFAFGQYTSIGNYNYIAPYSHEVLHGLLLSILAIALLADWLNKEKIHCAFAAGICSGLVFLTKPDIFVALAATCVAALVFFWATRRRIHFVMKSLAAFLSVAIIPPLAFFLYFLGVENWRESLRSILFGWLPLLQTDVANNPYYQWCLGFDQPFTHLRAMGGHFLFIAGAVAFYTIALRLGQKMKSNPARQLVQLLQAVPLLFLAFQFDWTGCGAALPLLTFAACVLLRANFKNILSRREIVFPLLWSVFGLILLLKLGLFSRIWHYGFALAMPAFVSAIYLLLWLVPRLLNQTFQVPLNAFRVIAGLALLIGFGNLLLQSEKFYASKNFAVSSAADRIMAVGPAGNSVEARTTQAALDWIETNVPTNATLAALPQGIIVNYLSRRINPTPCLDWNPTMFTVFSQQKMTDAFEKNPPDYILFVEWNAYEFGTDSEFGHSPGFGLKLMQWIQKNYQPVQLFGSEPFQNGLFGMKILKRMPAVP